MVCSSYSSGREAYNILAKDPSAFVQTAAKSQCSNEALIDISSSWVRIAHRDLAVGRLRETEVAKPRDCTHKHGRASHGSSDL